MPEPRSLFSRFRRQHPSGEADVAQPDPTFSEDSAGVPIDAFIEAGAVQLRLHAPAGRLSDTLNRETSIRVERTDGGAPPTIEDLLLLVPPPREVDRARRLHRPGRAVRIWIGPYEVTGDVHVPPGTEATGFLMRNSPRFVALTNAIVRSTIGVIADRDMDVALVNLQRAERFADVTAEDQPLR